jgi:hypothetical protein
MTHARSRYMKMTGLKQQNPEMALLKEKDILNEITSSR